MLARILLAAAAIVLTGAGQPGNSMSIALGAEVDVRVLERSVEIVRTTRGELQPFEVAAAQVLWAGKGYSATSHGATPGKAGIPAAPPIAPNEVHIKLMEYPAGQRLLAVENGTDRVLAYHARLHNGRHSEATTVCMVAPRKRTIEHWPWKVDWVELRDVRLIDLRPGESIRCS